MDFLNNPGFWIGFTIFILYSWYATIISRRNQMLEALSGIDVQLTKRHNLIPNILTIAQKFMDHEKSLLVEITNLREQALKLKSEVKTDSTKTQEVFNTENLLQKQLGQLMVSVENYPDLKSDAAMIQAQRTYNEVEEHIAAARRFYNSAVAALRDCIQIFPGNILANMVNVKSLPFFEANETQKAPINASDFFK